MAQYDTWTKTKDDLTVTISKKKGGTAGERLKALLEFIASRVPVDPDYGVPGGGGGGRPDQGLPGGGGGGRPDQGLPGGGGGGRPDQGLPPGPDNTLPGGGGGGRPSHPIAPGGGGGKPDQGGERPDNTLPGEVLKDHIDEIVKLVLDKCVDCKPETGPQPK